jgi:Tol biopolymer transport system component
LIEVVAGQPLRVLELDVSSDGSMIVFVGLNPATFEERLYVINTDGTGLRQLTAPTGYAADELPKFSPDGTEVLFGRRDDFCNLTYWIANTDGSGERQIATDQMSCEMDPYDQVGMDWSPDGSQIALVGIDQSTNWWRIYVVPSTVTTANYLTVRVPVGRDADVVDQLFEGQPNWRP